MAYKCTNLNPYPVVVRGKTIQPNGYDVVDVIPTLTSEQKAKLVFTLVNDPSVDDASAALESSSGLSSSPTSNTAIAAAAIAGGAADATEFAATVAATYAPLVNPTFHDVVKVKNSTTAQELQVYNTASGTADADSEYGFVNWVSNELRIGTAKTGTGTSRHMRLYSAGVLYLAAANNGYVLTFGNGAFYSGGTKLGLGANGWSAFYLNYTNTATVGAVTINMPSGRVNVAASATSVVVTNSLVTAASHVIAQPSTNDSTGRVTAVVPAAGSFTIYLTAPAAQMSIDFVVFGAD